MRLAFAVAAHLEPEILIVDEVLAVGDVEFQKKCLGKMSEVTSQGRTVLFVSHNMGAIASMTYRGLVLDQGRVFYEGSSDQVVQQYIASIRKDRIGWVTEEERIRKQKSGRTAIICNLRLRNQHAVFRTGDPIIFELVAEAMGHVDRLRVSYTIFQMDSTPVGSGFSNDVYVTNRLIGTLMKFVVTVRAPLLAPGQYHFGISLGRGNYKIGYVDYDTVQQCLPFEILTQDGVSGIASTWRTGWGPLIFDETTLEIDEDREANKEIVVVD